MSSKLVVFIAFLAVVSCGKPYRGYPLPFYPKYTNDSTEAPVDFAPWQASLQWGSSSYTHFCGGAIVNTQWILTSAHCAVIVPSYGNFVVKVGKQDLQIKESTEQTAVVEKSIIHPNYDGEVGPYDIALLKLSTPLVLTASVKTINLARSGSIWNGATVVLTGWGSAWRTYSPITPNKLQLVQVNIIDIGACNKSVIQLTGSSPLADSNVCAAPVAGGFTACNGDPGGPLVVKYSSWYELFGIGSWGIVPCGTADTPMIYTKVYSYTNWISNTMRTN